ncbi:MAG: hypothetical protein RL094_526 [Candidatus Parcubacteria bacterium]|jgi:translation initiation factor IF-1
MDTPKAGKLLLSGVVTEALPNAEFRIQLEGERQGELILGYLGGKMKLNRIRVLIGDRVSIEQDIHGGKGRIIRRF